jgi:hypothetical protein
VEGLKRARVWAMDNIKVDLQGIRFEASNLFRTCTGGGKFEIIRRNFGFFRNGIS